MLNDEVVNAVKEGKFHIYPVATIQDGIEILTGLPSGSRQEDGKFPPDTVFGIVERHLRHMYNILNHEEEKKKPVKRKK